MVDFLRASLNLRLEMYEFPHVVAFDVFHAARPNLHFRHRNQNLISYYFHFRMTSFWSTTLFRVKVINQCSFSTCPRITHNKKQPSISSSGGCALCIGRRLLSWKRSTWNAAPDLFWSCRGSQKYWAILLHRSTEAHQGLGQHTVK